MPLVAINHDPVEAMRYTVVEPNLYKVVPCVYVIVSITKCTIPMGQVLVLSRPVRCLSIHVV